MAFYPGVTPPSNPQKSVDIDGMVIGVSRIICDGSWLGSLRDGSKVELNFNPLDKDIRVAAYPGTTLGRRQLGESPTLAFESVEATLNNLVKFLDPRSTLVNGKLAFGRRNAKATYHTLDLYCEGPLQRTRRISFYNVTFSLDGAVNFGDPEEFTTYRVMAHIHPNLNLPEDGWYGEFWDSPPA